MDSEFLSDAAELIALYAFRFWNKALFFGIFPRSNKIISRYHKKPSNQLGSLSEFPVPELARNREVKRHENACRQGREGVSRSARRSLAGHGRHAWPLHVRNRAPKRSSSAMPASAASGACSSMRRITGAKAQLFHTSLLALLHISTLKNLENGDPCAFRRIDRHGIWSLSRGTPASICRSSANAAEEGPPGRTDRIRTQNVRISK